MHKFAQVFGICVEVFFGAASCLSCYAVKVKKCEILLNMKGLQPCWKTDIQKISEIKTQPFVSDKNMILKFVRTTNHWFDQLWLWMAISMALFRWIGTGILGNKSWLTTIDYYKYKPTELSWGHHLVGWRSPDHSMKPMWVLKVVRTANWRVSWGNRKIYMLI